MKRMFASAMAVALGLSLFVTGSPADAAGAEGYGAYVGTMTYAGDGIPPGASPYSTACRETRFDVSLTAAVTASNGDRRFDGPVTMQGNGHSGYSDEWRDCEELFSGTGVLYLTVLGTDARGATLHCEQLRGSWVRLETAWISDVKGTCTIDGVPSDETCFCFIGTWTPTPVGGGVATDATGAVLSGSLVF